MKRAHPINIDVALDASQPASTELIHRFRNYGEDLWRNFRNENRIHINLETIDKSVNQFRFTAVNLLMAKRAIETAEKMLLEHRLIGSVVIADSATARR